MVLLLGLAVLEAPGLLPKKGRAFKVQGLSFEGRALKVLGFLQRTKFLRRLSLRFRVWVLLGFCGF